LWQRFWAGSMTNASRFAMEYNVKKITEATDPIREDFNQTDALRLDLDALIELKKISEGR
jgi:hypothetical protein